MGVSQEFLTKKIVFIVALLIIPSYSFNVGLIASDSKRFSSPTIIRKVAKLSPVFININSGLPKITTPPLTKLPPKPPPLKLSETKLPKPKRSLLRPAPILLPPLIPPLPLLPILPPLLPPIPIIPKLPLLPPLPVIPRLPLIPPVPLLPPVLSLAKFKDPLKPLRVPILGKSPLSKSLGSKLKPVNIKRDILSKLLDLKIKGSLTTPEFLRFKKLLVK